MAQNVKPETNLEPDANDLPSGLDVLNEEQKRANLPLAEIFEHHPSMSTSADSLTNTFLLGTTDLTPLPQQAAPTMEEEQAADPAVAEATPETQEQISDESDAFVEAVEGNILDLPLSLLMMEGVIMQIGNSLNDNFNTSTVCFMTGFSSTDKAFQLILVPSESGNPHDDPRDDPDLYDELVEFLSQLYVYAEKGVIIIPEELSIEAPNKMALFETLAAFIDEHETLKTQENISFHYDEDIKDQQLKDMFGHAVVLSDKLMQDPVAAQQLFLNLLNRPYSSMREMKGCLTYVNTVDVVTPLSHIIKAIIREDGLPYELASDRGYHFGTMN